MSYFTSARSEVLDTLQSSYQPILIQRADCLEWEIIVMNKGDKPFDITMGLHNYFDVSSLKNVVISGPFSGASTLDRNANAEGTASRSEPCSCLINQNRGMAAADICQDYFHTHICYLHSYAYKSLSIVYLFEN